MEHDFNFDKSELNELPGDGSAFAFFPPKMGISLFVKWLEENTNLSESSIVKYSGAIRTVSREMHEMGTISKPLNSMSIFELDIAICAILSNKCFIDKNRRGNNMYSNALKQYRCFVNTVFDGQEENVSQVINGIVNNAALRETERAAIVQARIGQGLFRRELIKKYNGKCIITGIDHPKLLTASHIKPWSVSTNTERISVNNGLLLSATYDRLFDAGLITFDKGGALYLSSLIGNENIKRLHLEKDMRFELYPNHSMIVFLEYHNDVLFVR